MSAHQGWRGKMETKWKHRRIERLGDDRKILI
jgi:hypothetical protein